MSRFSFDTYSIYHKAIQEPVMIHIKKIHFSAAAVFILFFLTSCTSTQTKTGTKTEEPVQQKNSTQTIQQMILSGRSTEAKELFQAKIDINSMDENGNTALHAASQINDSELVTFLIYKGANTELKNHQGDTPLHLALKNDGKESAKIIAAADGTIFAQDGQNKTALELALAKGQDYFDVVITTKTGQMRDVNGRSLVHYLVDWENTEALEYAIQKKIPLSVEDNEGKSPLLLAYSKNESLQGVKIAASLIIANAAPVRGYFSYFEDSVKTRNPNLRFDDGQTPLHFASIFGHSAIVQYLLERGAQTKAKDILGSAPLHEACRYGQTAIVQLLLQSGADPEKVIKQHHAIAKAEGFYLGLKIVRGAYMEAERARAKEMGYPSPIQPNKQATDKGFDDIIRYFVDNVDTISFMVATHNEDSCQLLASLIEEYGLPHNHPHIYFSQLYGMSDHLTYNIVVRSNESCIVA